MGFFDELSAEEKQAVKEAMGPPVSEELQIELRRIQTKIAEHEAQMNRNRLQKLRELAREKAVAADSVDDLDFSDFDARVAVIRERRKRMEGKRPLEVGFFTQDNEFLDIAAYCCRPLDGSEGCGWVKGRAECRGYAKSSNGEVGDEYFCLLCDKPIGKVIHGFSYVD